MSTPRTDGERSHDSDDYGLSPSGKVSTGRNPPANGAMKGVANGRGQNGMHGGARPKTRGKPVPPYNVNNTSANKTGINGSGNRRTESMRGGEEMSYAKAASNTRWKTKQSKKRKFEKVSPRLSFPLKGKPATSNRDVYLQGLDVGDGNGEDDMLDSVKAYCIRNGITPLFVRIIPVKYDCTRVGCRLTVSEEDFERVIDDEFWPDNVSVREWTYRPRDNRGNGGAGARNPSDNED